MRLTVAVTTDIPNQGGHTFFPAQVDLPLPEDTPPTDAFTTLLNILQEDGSIIADRLKLHKREGEKLIVGRTRVMLFHDHLSLVALYDDQDMEEVDL